MRRKILLTNDDGIEASSLWGLKQHLSDLADCEVVAPRSPRSASSHAVSLADTICVHRIEKKNGSAGYGVDGTPADAIKFALSELFRHQAFDLIISGINLGPNTGVSVYYSGTIAAAREGVISGIPSFAVSLGAFEWDDFSYAFDLTRKIALRYLERSLPADLFLNVNVPGLKPHEIQGIRFTRQAPSKFVELFEREKDGAPDCFRLKGKIVVLGGDGDTDQDALEAGYVSITPLNLDMTHYAHMEETRQLAGWLERSFRDGGA